MQERCLEASDSFYLTSWEAKIKNFALKSFQGDSAHDIEHILRVVACAKNLAKELNCNNWVLIPAAYLHDCVSVPKNSPQRCQASRIAAKEACLILAKLDYPAEYLDPIKHAIEAHSFSAKIDTQTLEAEVLQDADRLDALGAIGISRCLMLGGQMDRKFYNSDDPFCISREPNDQIYTLDHFYAKLYRLPTSMKTIAGQKEALRRVEFMKLFERQLANELPA